MSGVDVAGTVLLNVFMWGLVVDLSLWFAAVFSGPRWRHILVPIAVVLFGIVCASLLALLVHVASR